MIVLYAYRGIMELSHFLFLSANGPSEMIFTFLQNDTELRNSNSLCSTGLALRWFVEVQTEVSHLWLHIFFPRI